VNDALLVFSRLADWSSISLFETGLLPAELVIAVLLIAGLFVLELYQPTDDVRDVFATAPFWVRWPAYYALVTIILTLGIFAQSPFIYFQF
jgi:hypothetical protein